jgi:hypothetical protein
MHQFFLLCGAQTVKTFMAAVSEQAASPGPSVVHSRRE